MSKLYFRYSPMNAGKSTALLQVAYNYNERGQRAIIAKPVLDTKSDKVVSRLGISGNVEWHVSPESNVIEDFLKLETEKVDCILIDEAQFLEPEQIDQFFMIAVLHKIPVIAYGLRSDFQTRAFPASARLLEIAHSIEEMKTICRCGSKTMFNGRKIDGVFTTVGDQIAIDGQQAEYESLCGKCFIELVGWTGPTS